MPPYIRSIKADGLLIRQKREESGTNLGRFAYEIGVTPGYLSRIELGIRNPRPEILAKIASRLGLTITDIAVSIDQAAS